MLARIREFLLHSCVELWSLLDNTCTLSDKFWKKMGYGYLWLLACITIRGKSFYEYGLQHPPGCDAYGNEKENHLILDAAILKGYIPAYMYMAEYEKRNQHYRWEYQAIEYYWGAARKKYLPAVEAYMNCYHLIQTKYGSSGSEQVDKRLSNHYKDCERILNAAKCRL